MTPIALFFMRFLAFLDEYSYAPLLVALGSGPVSGSDKPAPVYRDIRTSSPNVAGIHSHVWAFFRFDQ